MFLLIICVSDLFLRLLSPQNKVPPNYVHYLIGSMEENLIRKGGFSTDGDIEVEITPLSPILNSQMRNAPEAAKSENMERMIALELSFDGLDMSAE